MTKPFHHSTIPLFHHSTIRLALLLLFTFLFSLFTSLSAAVPVRWTVETTGATPATFEAYQGETLAFEANLKSHGKPLAAPAQYSIYWQTNGMGSAYWSSPIAAPEGETNVMFATWSPLMDVGARVYNCFIGAPGEIYRAAFQLRLRPSPGASPGTLEPPVKVLDFATVEIANAPWPAAIEAATNALDETLRGAIASGDAATLAAANAYTDAHGGGGSGGGGVDTDAVKEIVNAEVGGTNTLIHANDLEDRHYLDKKTDKSRNYTAITLGSRKSRSQVGASSVGVGASVEASGAYSVAIGNGTTASESYSVAHGTQTTASGINSHAEGARTQALGEGSHADGVRAVSEHDYAYTWNGQHNSQDEYESKGPGTYNLNPIGGIEGVYIGDKNLAEHINENAPTVPDWAQSPTKPSYSAAEVGAYPAASGSALESQVVQAKVYAQELYNFASANDGSVWFAATNYLFDVADAVGRTRYEWLPDMDATTVPPSMALHDKRDGTDRTVWDQRDWTVWYWNYRWQKAQAALAETNRAIRAEIASVAAGRAPLAWSSYTASGVTNPVPGTTWVDTPQITLAAGYSWQQVATVEGTAYWTIVGDCTLAPESATNSVMLIKDFEGNTVMRVRKGDKQIMPFQTDDMTNMTRTADCYIGLDLVLPDGATDCPVGYYSVLLEDPETFVVETSDSCPADYRWEARPDRDGRKVWRVYFRAKTGLLAESLFARFTYEAGAESLIELNFAQEIKGGLIYNGVKIAPDIAPGSNPAAGTVIQWKVVH